MSHHVYSTPGFVLISKNIGEANKFFFIFTRDLGMIGAAAQGIRSGASKLKPHLQDFSYSVVNVVRGKDIWRVTGAQELSEFTALFKKAHYYRLYVQTLLVLRRLLHGEEKHEELFNIILGCFAFLDQNDLGEGDMSAVEGILMLNVLHSLGYVEKSGIAKPYVGAPWSRELVALAATDRKGIVFLVNKALSATGL